MLEAEFLGGVKRGALYVAAAILFMGAGTNGYDAFSAVMSSPWSTRKFTRTRHDEQLAREYVRHAIIISGIYAGGSSLLSLLAGGIRLALAPVIGFAIVTAYMYRLYDRAATAYRTNTDTTADDTDGEDFDAAAAATVSIGRGRGRPR